MYDVVIKDYKSEIMKYIMEIVFAKNSTKKKEKRPQVVFKNKALSSTHKIACKK